MVSASFVSVSMAVTMLGALRCGLGCARHRRELLPRHGVMLVTLVWVLLAVRRCR